ncbi:TPA: hypothetical protein NJZ05_002847 [Vibrio parahaemolyticus]|nr:hypothetical protein [Vibrio parahaemolyticus]
MVAKLVVCARVVCVNINIKGGYEERTKKPNLQGDQVVDCSNLDVFGKPSVYRLSDDELNELRRDMEESSAWARKEPKRRKEISKE